MISEILAAVPDLGPWDTWKTTIQDRIELASRATSTDISGFVPVNGTAIQTSNGDCLTANDWRRFVVATLIADWATYGNASDRVDAVRLLFVMARFPAGFRVWFGRTGSGWLPLGYTGWYPIEEVVFRRLETNVPPLLDRALVPLTSLPSEKRYVYLFNYSVVAGLRKTEYSGMLMSSLAHDVSSIHASGLAAIAVSRDGIRIAQRFGMSQTGTFTFDGEEEWILTGRQS